jgi:mannose-6-phosphate isomerase-like protein (cupin superfamily)
VRSGASALPDFPGAVGLSQLEVYPWPTADDEHGGTPHFHLTCTECYVVTSGTGRLQTFGPEGPRTFPLSPGDVVWFTPGTIHRAVNDGDLRVLVIMQNSGLPEAGDAVLTFPAEYLTTERYAATVSLLDEQGRPSQARARARRDLALEGFAELQRSWEAGDHTVLDALHRRAADLVAPRLDAWEATVRSGAAAAADATLRQIQALRSGEAGHLGKATAARIARPEEQSLGMCGFLRALDPIRRSGASA